MQNQILFEPNLFKLNYESKTNLEFSNILNSPNNSDFNTL